MNNTGMSDNYIPFDYTDILLQANLTEDELPLLTEFWVGLIASNGQLLEELQQVCQVPDIQQKFNQKMYTLITGRDAMDNNKQIKDPISRALSRLIH